MLTTTQYTIWMAALLLTTFGAGCSFGLTKGKKTLVRKGKK